MPAVAASPKNPLRHGLSMLKRALGQLQTSERSLAAMSSYVEARKQVEKARSARVFRYHVVAFVLGNGFLGGWNALAHFARGDQVLWFFIPLIFWGVALLIHYVHGVILFEDWWGHSQAIVEATEENLKERERRKLSEELHDETLAELASVRIELGLMARTAPGTPPELEENLAELRERVRGTEMRLREIVRGIFPSALANLGLLPAVRAFLEDLASRPIESAKPLHIELSDSGFENERLPEVIELAAYRVIQQGVTNALQHAGAERLNIDLTWAESELQLTIADDGVGFEVSGLEEPTTSGHFGLANLMSRIQGVNGQFQIESKPSGGTTIHARIPTPERSTPTSETRRSTLVLAPAASS